MKKDSIATTSYFKIQPHKGLNLRLPYEHQKAALHHMDQMDTLPSYHTLIVLPTLISIHFFILKGILLVMLTILGGIIRV